MAIGSFKNIGARIFTVTPSQISIDFIPHQSYNYPLYNIDISPSGLYAVIAGGD
jgi:hypothetical protein